MSRNETRYLDARTRVQHGIQRENQIAKALREQAGLDLRAATTYEDKDRKVDRWLVDPQTGNRKAVQIKYRDTGNDLLFEVFDRFVDWDNPHNKVGRDMVGDANLYAVLLSDRKTVVMIPIDGAKEIITEMVEGARRFGWTSQNGLVKTFRSFREGLTIELKLQKDPSDGRQKMVCYIPSGVFQAQVYQVKLPHHWQRAR